MNMRELPDLMPDQVVRLQDALLENADALLTSALAVFDLGNAALARSLAILGLEESGKAIAVHERRIQIVHLPEGEPFRCTWLDELWASHEKKLEIVHLFLVEERYWFGTEPSDPEVNAAVLGTVNRWKRHDRLKQRGFYVGLGRTGEPMSPRDVSAEASFREVVERVHQIGWQLRLGEHIEGKSQLQQEEGSPAWDPESAENEWIPAEVKELLGPARLAEPGPPLTNADYRFGREAPDGNPFGNFGRAGYEAQTRELISLAPESTALSEDGEASQDDCHPGANPQ